MLTSRTPCGENGERVKMLRKIGRLFVIKTRWEAYLIIYALALGAMTRGAHYTVQYPGIGGYLLFAATAGAVFLGGAKILDAIRYEQEKRERERTMPPMGEIVERQKINEFERSLSRGQIENVLRTQRHSFFLMVLLAVTTALMLGWAYRIMFP